MFSADVQGTGKEQEYPNRQSMCYQRRLQLPLSWNSIKVLRFVFEVHRFDSVERQKRQVSEALTTHSYHHARQHYLE